MISAHTESHLPAATLRILSLLRKIDRLRLPAASRRDVESILVRQASAELDRMLPWQEGHGHRSAIIALKVGQAMGLTDADLHHLKLAALLHDIGLLLLPPRVSEAPSESDYLAVQHHSRLGAQLLEPFSFLRQAAVVIAHHHERWDGTGYPYGIRGRFIPLEARILSVADAFDAITIPHVTCRTSRDQIALRILKVASGTQFDPEIVHTLGRCLTSPHTSDRLIQTDQGTLVSPFYAHEDVP